MHLTKVLLHYFIFSSAPSIFISIFFLLLLPKSIIPFEELQILIFCSLFISFFVSLRIGFMALETWLIKVKKTFSYSLDSARVSPPLKNKLVIKKSGVGVLAFEIAGIMSKILHLCECLSDESMARFRSESIWLEGVRKIVSNDDVFLLGLVCAELVENLRVIANSISSMSKKCQDSSLRCFDRLFDEFANSGHDPHSWLMGSKELTSKIKEMERFVTVTASLLREIDELVLLENELKKSLHIKDHDAGIKEQKIIDLRQKILWQKQEVKYLKVKSLWCRSFDTVTKLLARSIFAVLARIKLVFGVGHGHGYNPSSLPLSLSASALVYPFENSNSFLHVSGPLAKNPPNTREAHGFFGSNSMILKPPSTTLGAAALALHYANVIIVMEKMIKSPQLVGADARDDLYSMLPDSIRFLLRARLKGMGFSASDPVLAAEWREALQKVLKWLSPLAHNMIKWQSERSFEQQNLILKTNVLLLQTLYFANQEKTEAAITELLVGLNYIWRFEREMHAKSMFLNCNGFLISQCSC
ncbi:protein PSK SIMULATOR 1-like [Primulina tabacum]|uniref:protein PSK SIMULATOR 1-like n=1 Tax=Primulina tabacum TaxID=48773 RepID=UPI003F59EFDD